ncbi:MAG: hypothetical protein LBD79_02635 [Treponema sp.]|jgi:hypothetical protein|nr:hypothetical protein [Treponema sp.]
MYRKTLLKKNRLNKKKNTLLKKYNKKKAEYDAESNTPAKNCALEELAMLKVVNGQTLVFSFIFLMFCR